MTEQQAASAELDLTAELIIEGNSLTLADLAGISMEDVEEVRGSDFPRGIFEFEILVDPVPDLHLIDINDKESTVPGAKKKCATARFTMECIGERLIGDPIDGTTAPAAGSVVGRKYSETFFIREVKDIGRIKAFVADIGGNATGDLRGMVQNTAGTRFVGMIVHTRDKNDTDKVYVNLNRRKLEPLATEAAAAAK